VRKNRCAPNENDLDRARRQQEVLSGMRRRLLSPTSYLRLPFVSWKAPRTVKTDLHGPGLMALATDVATGGSGEPRVLQPSCLSCGADGSLQISASEKEEAVQRLLRGG
jgi:hypothetical protein